eukprot:15446581-Alexandrium_andersonii.AAC.1
MAVHTSLPGDRWQLEVDGTRRSCNRAPGGIRSGEVRTEYEDPPGEALSRAGLTHAGAPFKPEPGYRKLRGPSHFGGPATLGQGRDDLPE